MKIAIALLLLITATWPVPSLADDTHYYGPQGQYQGRATTDTANPQQKSLYDAQGRYRGREMTSPNGETRVYDAQGRYQGRETGWTDQKNSK